MGSIRHALEAQRSPAVEDGAPASKNATQQLLGAVTEQRPDWHRARGTDEGSCVGQGARIARCRRGRRSSCHCYDVAPLKRSEGPSCRCGVYVCRLVVIRKEIS